MDYTQGTNTLTDTAGNAMASVGDALSVTVTNDTVAPTVVGVSSPVDGTFGLNDTIAINVQFSEEVTVTGTPQLTLETGDVDRTVNYVSGSGTNTLTFGYTVLAGDVSGDLDYASTSALGFGDGTIKDLNNNFAVLTLMDIGSSGSLSFANDIIISTL